VAGARLTVEDRGIHELKGMEGARKLIAAVALTV
jgi:hypothetical protein